MSTLEIKENELINEFKHTIRKVLLGNIPDILLP